MYMYMSKLINVSNEIYGKLSAIKGAESFSVVIENLLEKKSNKEKLLSFFGKGGIDEEAVKELRKGWKKWTEKYA